MKLGIADWNIAFEAIGFKNAIVVKDYPTDDPNFDPDDIHYNCYRFVASAGKIQWVHRGLILVRERYCAVM